MTKKVLVKAMHEMEEEAVQEAAKTVAAKAVKGKKIWALFRMQPSLGLGRRSSFRGVINLTCL